jgi:PhnB protein
MKIPPHYLPIMPYLIVNDATAFKNFMIATFNATEQIVVPRSENVIAHGELRIGDAVVMFADATEQFKPRPAGMFIYVTGVDNIYQAALKNGATSLHAPLKQEYGYTAGFEDKFGNQWWIVEVGD